MIKFPPIQSGPIRRSELESFWIRLQKPFPFLADWTLEVVPGFVCFVYLNPYEKRIKVYSTRYLGYTPEAALKTAKNDIAYSVIRNQFPDENPRKIACAKLGVMNINPADRKNTDIYELYREAYCLRIMERRLHGLCE